MVSDKKKFTLIFKITKINADEVFDLVASLIASLILLVRNFFLLIFYPYKTMRKLSLSFEFLQLIIIFLLIFFYFKFAYFLRDKPYPATLTFLIFLINFFATVLFFYFLGKIFWEKSSFLSLVFTFSYSLFPTLVWFGATSIFYLLLPPPRTMSILGQGFSIFYIAFSLSVLAWKMILVFLSLRFSLRLNFYQIVYLWIFYFIWFFPYSLLLFHWRLFRVPFI